MTLFAAEQYLLELINRARLNPAAEAARMGINLNDGLSPGAISTASKQVLAPNALLESAATKHTLWMLQADIFSHTGVNNSQPSQRASWEGYAWNTMGENIVYRGTTGSIDVAGAIAQLNTDLFLSAGHRANMLNPSFHEVGLGAEAGVFRTDGRNFNAAMLTEDFGTSGPAHFLTGVVYTDTYRDQFYTMGEGTAGAVLRGPASSVTTAAAGGYSLALGSDPETIIRGTVGATSFAVMVNMAPGNVKLDILNGGAIYTSGSVGLGNGINKVVLLGNAALSITGNKAANALYGNDGANVIDGGASNDTLSGNGGADQLHGGTAHDFIVGGAGADQIWGDTGNDTMTGGTEADVFVFVKGPGSDTITDFSVAGRDRLRLDDAIWAGQALTATMVVEHFAVKLPGEVLFDFGGGQTLHLTGLASLTGLAAQIEIF